MTYTGDNSGGVAVITGGASGFGLAVGERCAARGMAVVLIDRDGDRAEAEAATLVEAYRIDALGLGVDVADQIAVDSAAAVVAERLGRADVVVSNVGVQLFGAVENLTDDEWKWVLDINVVGSARVARAFLPLLRRSGRPRLAFTTSASVLDPAARMAAYQTSKFAVWGLAETLRLELAPEGISVSVIFPAGMLSRHLETSAEAQPGHVRRAIATEDDFTAMIASNPGMIGAVIAPGAAADRVIGALLLGERYIITHGDLGDATADRASALTRAAETAAKP